MTIEIKELGSVVLDAQDEIDKARAESAGLHTDTKALIATLQDVRTEINRTHEDLRLAISKHAVLAPLLTESKPVELAPPVDVLHNAPDPLASVIDPTSSASGKAAPMTIGSIPGRR